MQRVPSMAGTPGHGAWKGQVSARTHIHGPNNPQPAPAHPLGTNCCQETGRERKQTLMKNPLEKNVFLQLLRLFCP